MARAPETIEAETWISPDIFRAYGRYWRVTLDMRVIRLPSRTKEIKQWEKDNVKGHRF